MSNMKDISTPTSRALLVGAMFGGAASIASQWKQYQAGQIATDEMVKKVAKDTIKAGAVSGSVTYVAEKMSGQPILSLATIIAAGSAGLYLLDQHKESNDDE